MSITKHRLYLLVFYFFVNFVDNSHGAICNVCVCTQSETTKIVSCEKKHKNDNLMEIFDALGLPEKKKVDKLILSNHDIAVLPFNVFMRYEKLKSLDLSKNSMKNIDSHIFDDLKNLEDLNFSFNDLTTLRSGAFNGLESLMRLDVSNNNITIMADAIADRLPKLISLDISHNNLRIIDNDFLRSLTNLQFLDVSYNEITNLSSETLLQLRSLINLRATNNLLKNVEGEGLPNSLKILDVGNNAITSMPLNLTQIRHLNIQDNKLIAIDNDEWSRRLKSLNVSGNLLTDLPNVEFVDLDSLDISRNELKIIPETLTMRHFPSLKTLIISGNPIKDLSFKRELRFQNFVACNLSLVEFIDDDAFSKVKSVDDDCMNITVRGNSRLKMIKNGAFNGMKICSLDLSENALNRISPEAIKSGEKFVAQNGIDLQGNPLICDCESQWMLNDLVPHLYELNAKLLDNLRCDSPIELSGTRLVHWFKWKNRVLCDSSPMKILKNMDAAAVASGKTVMLESSRGMIAIVAAAMTTLCILIIVGIMIAWKTDVRRRRRNRRF